MNLFSTLYYALDNTLSNGSKLHLLTTYLEKAAHGDVLWVTSLVLDKKPKRWTSLSTMKEWYSLNNDKVPPWLFEASLNVSGDIAETIAILLPEPSTSDQLTLSNIMNILVSIPKDEDSKKVATYELWANLGKNERVVLNKLITGTFRMSIDRKLFAMALSSYLNQPETLINLRLHGNWTPQSSTFEEIFLCNIGVEKASIPYPFCHCHYMESELEDIGDPQSWASEYKWGGIRGQLIKRNGQVYIWTKDQELITDKLPEYHKLIDLPQDDYVIDGEIVTWANGPTDRYEAVNKRLNRKTITKKFTTENPISFIAYDLLEYEGRDQRGLKYSQRRERLEQLISSLNLSDRLVFSDEITFCSWPELKHAHGHARKMGAEGLIVKRINSSYTSGRTKGDWWKWKVNPHKVKAVLLYATRGQGRGSNIYSDYNFAVRHQDRYVPFAKTNIDLCESDIEEISAFIKSNTMESFGPVQSIKPSLVFEICFDSISKSPRHKSGISVRSPRVIHWLKDTPLEQINSLDNLLGLIESH